MRDISRQCVNLYQDTFVKYILTQDEVIALFNTKQTNPMPNLRNCKTYDVKMKKKEELMDKILISFFHVMEDPTEIKL